MVRLAHRPPVYICIVHNVIKVDYYKHTTKVETKLPTVIIS